MGAGRAIISTPFAYAAELLADGRGRLVAPSSPAAFAEAFTDLLRNTELRTSLGRRAYEHSRGMVWWEIGSQYRRIFDRVSRAASARPARRYEAVVA
jgi:glycosyltransferase involved in cell wall biosynthesis